MPLHIYPRQGNPEPKPGQLLTAAYLSQYAERSHVTLTDILSSHVTILWLLTRRSGGDGTKHLVLLSILMCTARGEFRLLRLFCCPISRDSRGHAASDKAALSAFSVLSTHECLSLRDKDHNIPSCKQINDRNKMGRDQMVSVVSSESTRMTCI